MKNKILIILLVLVIFGLNNIWWFTRYIDSGLNLDTEMGNHFYTRRSLEDLKKICLEIDPATSKDSLKKIIKKHFLDAEVFEKNGNIYYQSLGFIYEGNTLLKVTEDIPFNENSKG